MGFNYKISQLPNYQIVLAGCGHLTGDTSPLTISLISLSINDLVHC